MTILISILSCNNDKSECIEVACTEEFKTITVSIKDKLEHPIALNRFEVTIIESGIDITRKINDNEFELMKQNGIYPLFGDEYSETYKNKTIEIKFKGFDEHQELLNVDFTVGADCCHVELIDGITDVIID